jgi:hypothetical protein
MKNVWFLIIGLSLCFTSCTKEDLQSVLNGNGALTNEEVIRGLREALNVGTDTSVSVLHKLNGYYGDAAVKILLPPEAVVVYEQLNKIPGGSDLLEKTILAMNRAAEDAATEAKPIFVNAIKDITITDGFNILQGNDTAATAYLQGKTYNPLFSLFQPKINASLSKPLVLGMSAEETYSNLISAYNTASLNGILFAQIKTNSLSEHVTTKGLNGLFLKVAEQEKKIRKDPLAQVTDLLKRVFGSK